jgi:N6-adenosine-specific RNA methylase IME4/ParB-like chromosome segregation protein Spo0J
MKKRATPTATAASEPASTAAPTESRPTGTLQPHPEAGRLPGLDTAGWRGLLADIGERGVQVPLEIDRDGVVLDGHLRLRAARELGLEVLPVRVIAPPDQVEYLLLAALLRRQLSPSQRAALAVELDQYRRASETGRSRRLANLKGQPPVEVAELPPHGKTRDRAASWAGVSARTIQNAATVQAADPALFAQVKAGAIPADRAARRVLQQKRDKQLPPPAPLPEGPFELIYADPPWRLPGSPDSSRAVENHYPTMPLDEIAAMRVPAAEDAVLYLWAVPSMLPEALAVMRAWGFEYRGELIWVKDKIGLGHWYRNQHEPLLIGVRGNFKPPAPNRRFASVIHARRRRHSAKPEQFYELLEHAYPGASKLELFRRGAARPGWMIWGNQADGEEAGA